MRTEITPGQTSDYLGFDLVMADNLQAPRALLADRGYDADSIRKSMHKRDVLLVSPMLKSRKTPSASTVLSTGCATWSSGASISSRMPVVTRPAMTRPQRAFWASSTSNRSAAGSAICQHDLSRGVFVWRRAEKILLHSKKETELRHL